MKYYLTLSITFMIFGLLLKKYSIKNTIESITVITIIRQMMRPTSLMNSKKVMLTDISGSLICGIYNKSKLQMPYIL